VSAARICAGISSALRWNDDNVVLEALIARRRFLDPIAPIDLRFQLSIKMQMCVDKKA